jgi:hypothetical protein
LAHNLDRVRLLQGVFLLFLTAHGGSSGFSFNGFQENTPSLFLQESAREPVAKLCGGHARVAIQILRHAANYADVFTSERIEQNHISSGRSIARNAKKKYVLRKPSDHHQLIYGTIQDLAATRSGELWKEYLHRRKQAGRGRQLRPAHSRYTSRNWKSST